MEWIIDNWWKIIAGIGLFLFVYSTLKRLEKIEDRVWDLENPEHVTSDSWEPGDPGTKEDFRNWLRKEDPHGYWELFGKNRKH